MTTGDDVSEGRPPRPADAESIVCSMCSKDWDHHFAGPLTPRHPWSPIRVGATGLPLPDLPLEPLEGVVIGDYVVDVRAVPTPGICGYRLEGLSTDTHHLDLVVIIGGWMLTETQRDGRPEGHEFGWSRAWHYPAGLGGAAQAVAEAALWRVASPDGSVGEPGGWIRAMPGKRKPGETEPPVWACPACGVVSASPDDAREGYCGMCHDYTGPKLAGALYFERWSLTRHPAEPVIVLHVPSTFADGRAACTGELMTAVQGLPEVPRWVCQGCVLAKVAERHVRAAAEVAGS